VNGGGGGGADGGGGEGGTGDGGGGCATTVGSTGGGGGEGGDGSDARAVCRHPAVYVAPGGLADVEPSPHAHSMVPQPQPVGPEWIFVLVMSPPSGIVQQ